MKSFHKYKFILFACIIVLIFQTGCTDASPISATVPSATQEDSQNTEMDFTQIQAGDYSSLLGTWKEVAYADNRFDGTGQHWHTGRSEEDSCSLSVSTDKIVYNGFEMVMQGDTLTDYMGDHPLSFFNDGTHLSAYADYMPNCWGVTFYPKGAENSIEPNDGVQIDNTKNLIVVWFSYMEHQTVFELETRCTDDSSFTDTTQDASNTEMNVTQIEAGDYSSLLGTWKEVAYADAPYDGTGGQWYTGRSEEDSSSLSVSTDKIIYNGSEMIMQRDTLTDSMGNSYPLLFINAGTSLYAHTDYNAPIDWSVTFYPKGAENYLKPNDGVQIDNTKNLIVVYCGDMRHETVFVQE